MQQTLSIIKPDGVNKALIGEVIRRFEQAGLRIVALKMLRMSKSEAEGFYEVHRQRPFFDSLTTFMSSGDVVVMVVAGKDAIAEVRSLMGATNPKEASAGTIRADYASSIEQNIVHGSDAEATAKTEIAYFFDGLASA